MSEFTALLVKLYTLEAENRLLREMLGEARQHKTSDATVLRDLLDNPSKFIPKKSEP